MSASPEDLSGRTAGTYRIESRIGAGGMGEVYRAHDSKLERPVALKLLSADVAQDPERLRRFRSEARAASSLNHPHILIIHDFGELESRPFIITELVEGQTLRQKLESGPIVVPETIEMATQVASALSAAHARGIVHRDIKPENIMVRPDGYVKVLDFGLAKLMSLDPSDDQAESMLRTEPGIVLGTPRYMSPEQARGLDTDPRTDVWSLGVVIYEMVAGRAPFIGSTNADLISSILTTDPLPLDVQAAQVPVGLARIVARALRKNPVERFASAADMHAALVALRAGVDSGVAPVSLEAIGSGTIQHTVGREKERSELLAAFRQAAGGRGHVLSVSGDAGSGKTTVVESFLDVLSSAQTASHIGRGRCSERLAGSEAYLPVLEAIESLVSTGDDVRQQIAEVAPSWYAQVSTASSESSSPARPEMLAGSQERLKREIAALARELSRNAPLVLFFDDVHWADASTIDLLAYLAPRFAELRVLIIVTSRPSDLLLANHPFGSLRQDLQGRRLCHELALDMLTRDDVHRYLALEFPGHGFPADLADLIHAKTEGSPLFMADLVRYLGASGTLQRDANGRWLLEGSLAAVGRELPESVRGMIERKIAQVSDEDRALLTAASVQGYEFDSSAIAQALGQDPGRVEERLEVLERVHRFVKLVDEREFPDRTLTLRYRFVHVLYQNALYAQLRATRRVALSAAVAETLWRFHGSRHVEIASELAALFEAARDYLRAAEYYRLAAQNAAQLFASREGVVLATRGISLLEQLPDSRERQERELALRVSLGNALIATRGYSADEVLETYTRAHILCEQIGETPHLSAVLYGFAALYLVRGNQPRALQYGNELVALTERQNDPALVVGHRLVGFPLLSMGHLEKARTHFEAAGAMYVPVRHRPLAYVYGQEPGMASRIMLATTLWLLGEVDQARRCRDEALDIARQTAHGNSQCYALYFAAVHDQLQGDLAAARSNADAALKLAEEQGLTFWLGWAGVMRGWAMTAGGDLDAGIREMRRGIDTARASGAALFHTYYLGLLADALCAAERFDEASSTLDEAASLVVRNEERFWESQLVRLRGLIAWRKDDRQSAEDLFRRAIAIAREQGAQSLVLRAEQSLSQLRWQAGMRDALPPTRDVRIAESKPDIDSLAVLPFANASGDAETDYVSDGITESLINRLSQIPSLRIVPRSTTFRYKGQDIDPKKVGRQLKVQSLLTGKVLQRGDTLSVQAELIDVKQNAQLWGERFARRVSDILTVEDEIATQITEKLRLKLTGEERDGLVKRDTKDTEAYHLYLKGRYYWSKRTGPDLKKSVGYFEQAIAKDPGYALAYTGLADAYVVMSVFDGGMPRELLSKAKAAARRAIEIDPDLPEAHAELCLIWPCLDRDWDAADEAFRSAMKRKPAYWLAHDHYAMTLAARGRFDEAIAEVRRGQQLEPLSLVVHHHAAWIYLLARRYDDVITECRTAIEMDPNFPMAHLWMGISLEQQGRYDEAIASLEQAVKCMGGASIGVAAAAHAYAMAGQPNEARRRLAELQHAPSGRYVQHYGLALICVAFGERDEAMRWLEQADRDRSMWLALWANVDPRLDVLRDGVRFQNLLRRLQL